MKDYSTLWRSYTKVSAISNARLQEPLRASGGWRSNKRPGYIAVATTSLVIVLVLAVFAFVGSDFFVTSFVFPTYALLVGIVALIAILGKRWLATRVSSSTPWLHPPLLVTVWFLCAYCLPGAYTILVPNRLLSSSLVGSIDPKFVTLGLLLELVGLISMWLAYTFAIKSFTNGRHPLQLAKREPGLIFLGIIYSLSVLMQIIQIAVVGTGYRVELASWGPLSAWQQWFGYIQEMHILVMAVVALKVFQRKWSSKVLVLLIAIEVTFGSISGFMKPILWLVIILGVAAVESKVRIKRFVPFVIVGLIASITVVSVAEGLRVQIDRGQLDTKSLSQLLSSTTNGAQEVFEDPLLALDLSWGRTLYRQAQVVGAPGLIMARTPDEIPFKGGETFFLLPAYLVPRGIWADKPELTQGNWYSLNYLNMPSFTTSSTAITVFGEGYIIFGWLGTIIASGLLGLLLAYLYRKTVPVGLEAILIALVPTFLDVEGQFTVMFVGLIQRALIFFLVYWIGGILTSPSVKVKRN